MDKNHTAYLVVGLEKVHHELLEADGIAWWGPITCAGGVAMFQHINGPIYKPTPLLWWQHQRTLFAKLRNRSHLAVPSTV